jgi:anaerobic magnesium-protoporphyrin IX monomethyl ester cyclase
LADGCAATRVCARSVISSHFMRVCFATLRSGEVASFGIMYVSTALQRAGHITRLVEAANFQQLSDQLRSDRPDILAFSATTGLHRIYLAWAREAKRMWGVTTLFGGPHPTFFPEMAQLAEVDAIVIGEGDETTPELLDALRVRDGRQVAGAVYRHEGSLIRGLLRPPVQDLDGLGLPDRGMYFDQNKLHRRFPVKAFVASRGCPYRCAYCFNRTLNDMYRGRTRAVRFRSPAAVIREVLQVKRTWPMKLVWFLDANFVVSRSWVKELCERMQRDVRLPFYCKLRPNGVDEDLARTLGLGGCTGVGMGIEAGDDSLREGAMQRHVSREQILNACRCLHDAGIAIMAFNMVGLPGETYPMALSTVDLNVQAGVDYAMATVFQPYPRTVLSEWAIERGYFDGDFDRIDTNYYSTCQMREQVAGDRKRIERLQRLFAVAVHFPEVRRHIDRLVEIDAPRLYTSVFKLWHKHRFHTCFYERYRNPRRQQLERLSHRPAL